MREPKIRRKPNGKRYAQAYVGKDHVSGRVVRPQITFPDALSDDECLELLREWLDGISPTEGIVVGRRLGEVLARYIVHCEKSRKAANTVKTYRTLSSYVAPIAGMDVGSIGTDDINRLYALLETDGGRDGKGLSPATLSSLHWFLRGAFKWMEGLGIVKSSPVAGAAHAKYRPAKAAGLTAGEIRRAEKAISEHLGDEGKVGAAAFAAYLALHTGMRCGEACALRICDVQGMRSKLVVHGTVVESKGGPAWQPRTKSGKPRSISITGDVLDTVLERVGVLVDMGLHDRATLVTVDGGLMRPSEVSGIVRRILAEAGLPQTARFHTLRHTHATVLLSAGTGVGTVQRRLGHASPATTLGIYDHETQEDDRDAAEAFARETSDREV